jgi:hypothetical protein
MDMLLKIDDHRVKEGFVDAEKAISIAARRTLNTQAALTRRNGLVNINKNFHTRNSWTERNIIYEQTRKKKIENMESRTGATEDAEYMKLQELGGVHRPKKRNTLAIPEDPARGGNFAQPVSKKYYMSNLRGSHIVKGKYRGRKRSARSRTVATAYVAHKTGKLVKRKTGIYRVTNFRKKSGSIKFRMIRLYNLQKRSTRVPKQPWLLPAAEKPVQDGQSIFNSQIRKQLSKDLI